ncbi:hypothetical protein IMSHALPRED_004811 [Imshaugia aleurites]|uniref:Uncharacterized protein n=1 Tax=Imshaugia aleurites TaxID=172621 RepID=A0A8H3FDL6_9LECA|nr:hypothetical protein IMSHALPRED_004811 [Imshaugia aleurites]
MGSSLTEYLRIKVHPSIQNKVWSRIVVEGIHERNISKAYVSPIEKRDKPFNWQRPTTSVIGPQTLRLQCFPGVDYVKHYAAITATYLSLKGETPDSVYYTLPSETECLQPLLHSNLREMGRVDIVIVGYVQGFERWAHIPWEGDDSNELFAWKKISSPKGHCIAFLGCRVSFWGDISGNVVRALQTLNGAKCVLYVGKLGSLRAEHSPNQWLATGCQSLVRNRLITWTNPLEHLVHDLPSVVRGVHCTLGSVLDETKEWLRETEKKYDFVDPEIGHMGKASLEGGTEFGYLHIISDNLAMKYIHDLSNERLKAVLHGRKRLVGEIENVLSRFFDQWSPT